MPISAQPTAVKVDQEALNILLDNFDYLEHPSAPNGILAQHPGLKHSLGAGREGRNENKKRFCEAILFLFDTRKPHDEKEAIELLTDNLGDLPHPRVQMKQPYFAFRWAADPTSVRNMTQIYAEGWVWLLKKHNKLNVGKQL